MINIHFTCNSESIYRHIDITSLEMTLYVWKNTFRKAGKILRCEFSRNCPVCNNEMKYGYITDFNIKWIENGKGKLKATYPFVEQTLYFKGIFRNWNILPAYTCDECRVAIAKWNMNHLNSTERIATKQKGLSSCPYCGNQTKSGRLHGNKGIRWADDVSNLFLKKMKFIEPLPRFKSIGLPALKCKKCGIFIVRYKPQNTWLQMLKVIALLSIVATIAYAVIFGGAYMLGAVP